MIEYFIHSTLILGIAFLIYRLLLKNNQTFHFNRFFLLGTFILALCLPLIEFEIPHNQSINIPFHESTFAEQIRIDRDKPLEVIEPLNQNKNKLITFQNIYFLGVSLLSLRFIIRLSRLYQLSRKDQFISDGLRYIATEKDSVFSFFNCLFIPKKMHQKKQLPTSLLNHEKVHIVEKHSFDLILVEIGTILAWLNPMVWLMKKAIEENHEFRADAKAARNKADYCATLINFSRKKHYPLSIGFSYQNLKKRIQMINQVKPSKMKSNSIIAAALIGVAVTFLFSSFQNLKITKPYTVIIDAGHGGKDHGASAESVLEKDLSLLYAQLISQRLVEEGIEVIQLRKEDEFITLADRIMRINQLARNNKADLLLSIHINKGPIQLSGMQVYLPKNQILNGDTSIHYFESLRFASALSNEYGNEMKIMPAPFTMLKSVNCPAALVELGFLSNKEEREKLLNEKYQNQLSAIIAGSVVKSMN